MRRIFHLRHLPSEYRKHKVIGRGATSIVLELPDELDKVLMFTMDLIKKDWLTSRYCIDLDADWEYHYSDQTTFPIFSIKMKRLRKLSKENQILTRKAVTEFYEYVNDIRFGRPDAIMVPELDAKIPEESILSNVIRFLSDYVDYCFDLHLGNFMEDENGKIIVIDPVISTDVMQGLGIYD